MLFRIPVCWFVLQSAAFCSAVGKAQNQSPGEQSDADIDKLRLSLSICLNDVDAHVGSLEEAQGNKVHMLLQRLLQVCSEKFVHVEI